MTQKELNVILDQHQKWLNEEEGGKSANLEGADLEGASLCAANLCEADLCEANLREARLCGINFCVADLEGADLRKANLVSANLRRAFLAGADLSGADLREAILCEADLCGANLCGADLDYSCWPLWCGSLDVKVDARIARQLAYHFCRLDCDDPEYLEARESIASFANKFHRVDECGRIEE